MAVSIISLAELMLPKSAQQIVNDSLAFITNPPDPTLVSVRTANWRPGGPYRTLLYRQGIEASLLYQILAGFAGSAFLRYATGRWLDWLGQDYFDEARQGASFATAIMTVTIPAGAGPVGPVPIKVSTTDGKTYTSIVAVTLPAGPASTLVTVRADKAGSAYNVGAGNISQLVSPNILGITVSNAANATGGYDEETDQRYATRLMAKWGVLATGTTANAYIYFALTASQEVQKVSVLPNSIHGVFGNQNVTVVVSGLDGPVSADALVAVYNFTAPKVPLDVELYVDGVVIHPVTVTGTVQVYSPYLSVAPAGIANGLKQFQYRVPIGGYSSNPVPVSEFTRAVFYDPSQVFDVQLATPAAPVSLGYNELLIPTSTIVPTAAS